MSTKEEVAAAIDFLGYQVPDREIEKIAKMLDEVRKKMRFGDSQGWSCLRKGGNGIVVWVKSRCAELDLLPKHSGQYAIPSNLVTALFHFESWDEDRFGEWDDRAGFAIESRNADVKRSPLSRIVDSSPINRVARKIAGNGDRACPYCKRYFRNPAAMVLHIEQAHVEVCLQRR